MIIIVCQVVICFWICNFELSETPFELAFGSSTELWFAFEFVTLNYRKHHQINEANTWMVVICFWICNFELSETPSWKKYNSNLQLWFAFEFVTLNYRKHHVVQGLVGSCVVICFWICNFELSETPMPWDAASNGWLWFAFEFVTLNYRKHLFVTFAPSHHSCDLLLNL